MLLPFYLVGLSQALCMYNSFPTSLEDLHTSPYGIYGSGFSLVSHLALWLAPGGYTMLPNCQPNRSMKSSQMPSEVPGLRIKSCLSVAITYQRGWPFQGIQPGLLRAKLGGPLTASKCLGPSWAGLMDPLMLSSRCRWHRTRGGAFLYRLALLFRTLQSYCLSVGPQPRASEDQMQTMLVHIFHLV